MQISLSIFFLWDRWWVKCFSQLCQKTLKTVINAQIKSCRSLNCEGITIITQFHWQDQLISSLLFISIRFLFILILCIISIFPCFSSTCWNQCWWFWLYFSPTIRNKIWFFLLFSNNKLTYLSIVNKIQWKMFKIVLF